jgi:DNA-binding CsgD family transcriptional regulator
LEIYEGRVQTARQRDCSLTSENYKLRNLIKDMLFDRAVFNSYWRKIVKKLKNRRKFLLDMIERSNQAFNAGADFLDNFKKLQSRRMQDKEMAVSEMINMERQIDANEIMDMFLGGKGKRRFLAPLEDREIRRRDNFKENYSNRLNLYHSIIEDIKKLKGFDDIGKAMDVYLKEENDGFQFYNYLNEMNHQIEYLSNDYRKLSTNILGQKDFNTKKLEWYNQQIAQHNKDLENEINVTLKLKDEREKYETEIAKYLDTILEIMKILNCDLSSIQQHLGDHKKITVFNMQEFLALLENRANEVLAFIYCEQRKGSNILADDSKFAVKSLKRNQDDPITIGEIIDTCQCAECAEGEDVNRYDENLVYPMDYETIREIVQRRAEAPEIAYRLHNLSKCNLPRSGIIASRRYAE